MAEGYGRAMAEGHLTRRALLGFGVWGSLALLESSLAGCARRGPRLAARRGELPERWVRLLPRDWVVRWLEEADQVQEAAGTPISERPALVQLGDGWATALPRAHWSPFGHGDLLGRLDGSAASASRLFGGQEQAPLGFPWSCNPWVLVLRDRPDLARQKDAGWSILLDPSLTGKVVLPSSPRVVMALMRGDRQGVCQLRRQALALDDRHGLNLLLSGPAQAAVLPRQLVVPLLRRDPRLAAVLPPEGAPRAWSMLLRPAGLQSSLPGEWLEAILQPPLLPRVLATGWVPPLPRPLLVSALKGFAPVLTELLLPPEAVLGRCTDLPPLQPAERRQLQELWSSTSPCQRV